MNKEYQKFSQIREGLDENDRLAFDEAYEKIKNTFFILIANTKERISGEKETPINTKETFGAIKKLNELGNKVGISLRAPEEDEYLLKMYIIKFGSEILKGQS